MSRLERGALVAFRIRDVFFPDAPEALRRLTGEVQVCGRLLFFSDAGRDHERFAVVEVEGMTSPVVVAVDRLQAISLIGGQALEKETPSAASAREERR